jgi:hypothetical protein
MNMPWIFLVQLLHVARQVLAWHGFGFEQLRDCAGSAAASPQLACRSGRLNSDLIQKSLLKTYRVISRIISKWIRRCTTVENYIDSLIPGIFSRLA